MHWILLIILIGKHGNEPAVAVAEFNTKAACEKAAGNVNAFTGPTVPQTLIICTPKGESK